MLLDVNALSQDLEKESCNGSVSLLSLTLASLRHFPNVFILQKAVLSLFILI